MAKSRVQLRQDILQHLHEDADTVIAQIASGTGSVTVSHDTYVDTILDRAAAEICRTCYPIPGRGQKVSYSAGQHTIPLSSLTGRMDLSGAVDDGSTVWFPGEVYYNNALLRQVTLSELEIYTRPDGGVRKTASGVPYSWYQEGNSIGIFYSPSSSANLDVYGYMIPPSVTTPAGDEEEMPWLDETDDLPEMMTQFGARELCRVNLDDANLAARFTYCNERYNELRVQQWASLPASIRESVYRDSPVGTIAAKMAAPTG